MDTTRQRFDSLTGLRFILAIWIAYFHVAHMYDHDGFGKLPYLELGVARVDVFFVLSGFVLTHIYWSNSSRPFDFGDFLMARVARIYPLHLLALGVMLGFLTLGLVMGRSDMAADYPVEGLFANLFMMQSFGIPGGAAWNFPAWAISAEFAGYLAFPLYIWLATKMKSHRTLFFGLTLLNVLLVSQVHLLLLERDISTSTMTWGALRGAVVMLAGVGARVALEDFKVSGFRAGIYAVAGAICALLAAMNHVGTAFVAAGGALMIMSLARLDQLGKGTFLAHPRMCMLGGWSYAIFILHVPTFMILKNALDILGIPFEVNAWTSLAFTLVIVAIAYPVHHLIEEPCRKAIRGSWEKRTRREKSSQTA